LDKCCPLDVLERVISALVQRDWSAGWMIGPDEIERFGDAYRKRLEASAPVIVEESIEAAADLVCGARVYIGNDAGMTHLAALVGLQTFVVFGPTDPHVWRPLGNACHVVQFPPKARSTEAATWIDDLLSRIDRV
jgi:ADP-heptose:LPS heptosyltransferase